MAAAAAEHGSGSPESLEARDVYCSVLALQSFVEVLDKAGEVTSTNETHEAATWLRRFQLLYLRLRQAADTAGVAFWKLRPKWHVLEHIGATMRETRLNPRYYATWMDEDLMGKMRDICARVSQRGVTVAKHALTRWIWTRAELLHELEQAAATAEGAASTAEAAA